MQKSFSFLLIACVIILTTSSLVAQEEATEEPATIPNIVGLNVPFATSMLNQLGITIGEQTLIEWNTSLGVEPNRITQQSISAGTPVTAGLQMDIVIAHPFNMEIIFDDNDLTLLNQTGGAVDLAGLVFTAIDARIPATFSGVEWTSEVDSLSPERCVQIWSIGGIGQAKSVEGCQASGSIPWLSRINDDAHFWIDDNGATGFSLIQDGIYRGDCAIIPNTTNVQQCEIYTAPIGVDGVAEDVTAYVYFRYNDEQLWVINRSDDRWMPSSQVDIVDAINLGDSNLFAEDAIIGNVSLLAPHQCVLYTNIGATEPVTTPDSCDLIAIASLDPDDVFWLAGFEITSRIRGENLACVTPQSEGDTLCLLPR